MMKYKNITNGVLKFRAHDKEGIKKEFELEPGKEVESDRELRLGGLKLIKKKSKESDK